MYSHICIFELELAVHVLYALRYLDRIIFIKQKEKLSSFASLYQNEK